MSENFYGNSFVVLSLRRSVMESYAMIWLAIVSNLILLTEVNSGKVLKSSAREIDKLGSRNASPLELTAESKKFQDENSHRAARSTWDIKWPSETTDFRDALRFDRETVINDDDAVSSKGYFDVFKCKRYCIEAEKHAINDMDRPMKSINLIFSIVNETHETVSFAPENNLTLKLREERKNSETSNAKCQTYLDLNCDSMKSEEIENTIYGIKFDDEKYKTSFDFPKRDFRTEVLAEQNNVIGYTERKFSTDDSTQTVLATIDDNFSDAIFEIPMRNKDEEKNVLALSLVRTNGDRRVNIVVRGAPSGEWRFKLIGDENTKYNYSVIALRPKRDARIINRDDLVAAESVTSGIIKRDDAARIASKYETHDKKTEDVALISDTKSNDTETEERDEKAVIGGNIVSVRNIENADEELNDLDGFTRNSDSPFQRELQRKRVHLETSRNNDLIATPGTIHRVLFTIKNTDNSVVKYDFRATSTPLRVYNVLPPYVWVPAGQTDYVAVDIDIPANTAGDTINTVTLVAEGSYVIEKSVYLYVKNQNLQLNDVDKPSIEYWYNNNCAGRLSTDRCEKSQWSVDIRVHDSNSGLKSVTSSTGNLYNNGPFISGTRNAVSFYYTASCCSTTVKIIAVDVLNNENSLLIDVTAWNNLTEGEIAAICLGAFLILFIIIAIILAIVYCVQRRKSQDLTFTQRYGSRTPGRTEGTNF